MKYLFGLLLFATGILWAGSWLVVLAQSASIPWTETLFARIAPYPAFLHAVYATYRGLAISTNV